MARRRKTQEELDREAEQAEADAAREEWESEYADDRRREWGDPWRELKYGVNRSGGVDT